MVETHDGLAGQVALVTGAADGAGATVARDLAARDATVYAGARSMSDDTPEETERVLLDVTQEGDVESVVDGIYDEVGRLDVLVNAATADAPREGDLVAQPTQEIDRVLATTLRGPTLVCKHAVALLIQNEGGRVVTLGSADSPAARIATGGAHGLSEYLDETYEGLLANAVAPGEQETVAETAVWLATLEAGGPSGETWREKEARA